MHIQTFYPNRFPGPVTVTIEDEDICFYQGIDDEKLLHHGEVKNWQSGGPFYPSSIFEKEWFTHEMYEFINKTIKL